MFVHIRVVLVCEIVYRRLAALVAIARSLVFELLDEIVFPVAAAALARLAVCGGGVAAGLLVLHGGELVVNHGGGVGRSAACRCGSGGGGCHGRRLHQPEAKLRSQAAAGESSDGDSGAVLCREVFW